MDTTTIKRLLFASPDNNNTINNNKNQKNAINTTKTNSNAKARIQVCVRIRPQNGQKCLQLDDNQTTLSIKGNPTKRFQFEKVFDESTSQEDIFLDSCSGCSGLVDKSMDGFNGTILAYGQTGSGKTHTMFGDLKPGSGGSVSSEGGIIPAAVQRIFHKIEEKVGLFIHLFQLRHAKLKFFSTY